MNTAIVITLALAVAVTYASPAASKDVRQTSSESVPKVRSRDAHSLVRRATHMKYADAPQDSSTAITQQKDIVSDLLEGVFDNDKRGLFTSDSDNSNFMWKSITWVIKRLLDRSPIGAIIDNFIRGKDENQEEEEEEEEKEKGSFGTRQQVIHVNGWPPEDKKYFQIHVNGWPPEDGKSKNCTAKKWKRREIFDQRWNFQNRKMYGLGMGGSPFHPGMPVGGFPGQMMPPGAVPVVDTPQLQNPAGFPMGMFQQPMMGNPMLLHPGQEGLGQLNQMLPQLQAQQQQSKLQAQVQQLQLQAQSQQPQLQTQLQAQLQALLQEPLIQALLRQPQLQALLQPSCLNLSKQPDIHLNIDQKWLAAVNKLVAENKDDKKPEVKEKKDEKKEEHV